MAKRFSNMKKYNLICSCNNCALFDRQNRICGHAPHHNEWYKQKDAEYKQINCCRFEHK